MSASRSEPSPKGRVYLAGAGPGDPDLLTRKALRLLNEADVILHDDLVSPAILGLAGKQALVISVGKRCGQKKITQASINDSMISAASRGLTVVRLKSGDPLIFGRAGEEMDALRQAGVPFEIVPGVTAASSAAAFLEVPLTDRRFASKLIVVSGHPASPPRFFLSQASADPGSRQARETRSSESSVDGEWMKEIAGAFASGDATLVIYMPGQNLGRLSALLLESGVSAQMPCVVVSNASRPEAIYQPVRLSGLGSLAADSAPRILLAGKIFEAVLAREASVEETCFEVLNVLDTAH